MFDLEYCNFHAIFMAFLTTGLEKLIIYTAQEMLKGTPLPVIWWECAYDILICTGWLYSNRKDI